MVLTPVGPPRRLHTGGAARTEGGNRPSLPTALGERPEEPARRGRYVARAVGWSSLQALQQAYQHPHDETMLQVVEHEAELREVQ